MSKDDDETGDLLEYGERQARKYPDVPGFKEGTTSREAALAMNSEAGILRERCMGALRRRGPLTADEIADELGRSVLAVRPRLSELKRDGRVVDTGDRRMNASGKRAAVLALSELAGGME